MIEEHDININGARLHVQQLRLPGAAGAPIVFLHDSFGCIELWRDFPSKLCELTSCNGVAYDRQGYGQSDPFTQPRKIDYLEKEAHTLLALLDELRIERAVLFGHSDGGSIALLAAALAPDRIVAAITEGAHVFVEDVTISGIRTAQAQYHSGLRSRLYKYHADKTDAMFRAWADTWTKPDYLSWNIEFCLPRIKCPLLVMQGEHDEYGTERQVDAIVSQSGAPAEKVMIARAGHTPHREAAEETLCVSAAFILNILLHKA